MWSTRSVSISRWLNTRIRLSHRIWHQWLTSVAHPTIRTQTWQRSRRFFGKMWCQNLVPMSICVRSWPSYTNTSSTRHNSSENSSGRSSWLFLHTGSWTLTPSSKASFLRQTEYCTRNTNTFQVVQSLWEHKSRFWSLKSRRFLLEVRL